MGQITGTMNGLNLILTVSPKNELRGMMNELDRLFVNGEITQCEWRDRQNEAIKKYRKSFK